MGLPIICFASCAKQKHATSKEGIRINFLILKSLYYFKKYI
jgi:hypothetical protein